MAETEDLIFDSNGIYIPQTWSDELVDSTAITPQRLDHIEQGIKGTSESLKEFSDSVSQKEIYRGKYIYARRAGHNVVLRINKTLSGTAWNMVAIDTLPESFWPKENKLAIFTVGTTTTSSFANIFISVEISGIVYLNPANQTFTDQAIYGTLSYVTI